MSIFKTTLSKMVHNSTLDKKPLLELLCQEDWFRTLGGKYNDGVLTVSVFLDTVGMDILTGGLVLLQQAMAPMALTIMNYRKDDARLELQFCLYDPRTATNLLISTVNPYLNEEYLSVSEFIRSLVASSDQVGFTLDVATAVAGTVVYTDDESVLKDLEAKVVDYARTRGVHGIYYGKEKATQGKAMGFVINLHARPALLLLSREFDQAVNSSLIKTSHSFQHMEGNIDRMFMRMEEVLGADSTKWEPSNIKEWLENESIKG